MWIFVHSFPTLHSPFICSLEEEKKKHVATLRVSTPATGPRQLIFPLSFQFYAVRVSALLHTCIYTHTHTHTLQPAACARHTFHRAGLRHTFPILSERAVMKHERRNVSASACGCLRLSPRAIKTRNSWAAAFHRMQAAFSPDETFWRAAITQKCGMKWWENFGCPIVDIWMARYKCTINCPFEHFYYLSMCRCADECRKEIFLKLYSYKRKS